MNYKNKCEPIFFMMLLLVAIILKIKVLTQIIKLESLIYNIFQ